MVWNIYYFSIQLGIYNHPNWRTPSFFRGVAQPPTRWFYHDVPSYKSVCQGEPHVARSNSSGALRPSSAKRLSTTTLPSALGKQVLFSPVEMGLKEQKIGILPAEIRNLPVKIGIQLILANLVWHSLTSKNSDFASEHSDLISKTEGWSAQNVDLTWFI